ncbi:MAG: tetratricopeptide repeat protein [Bacteroidota bacterium]
MRKYVVVAVLVVLIFPGKSSPQNARIDSLLQVYQVQPMDTTKLATLTHLINAFMYRDPQRSMVFARENLLLARDLEYGKWKSLANFHMGVLHNNADQYDSAGIYFNRAYDLALSVADSMRMVLAVNGLATLYLGMGNFTAADSLNDINIALLKRKDDRYRLATAYAMKSQINQQQGNLNIAYNYAVDGLRLMREFDKPVRMADILLQLATIEQELGNITDAIEHSKEALQIYQEHNDLMYQALMLANLGDLFLMQGNYNESQELLQQSIAKADSAGSLNVKATALNRLGNLYLLRNQYSLARQTLAEGLDIASLIGDLPGKVAILNTLGMLFNKTGNPRQAIQSLDESILISQQLNLKPDRSKAYLERSLSHEQLGLYSLALSDYKTHKQLSDSIFAKEALEQIKELRIIYETEQKDQEIEIQKFQIDLLAQRERNQRGKILLLTILLVSSVLTVFLVHLLLRQKLKRRQLEHQVTQNMLALQKRELTTQVLHIAQKNDLLQELKGMIRELKSECPNSNLQKKIINKINIDINNEQSWERFQNYFEDLHKGFGEKIKKIAPEVSPGEIRLISLLKMNLNSHEVASVLNISQEGIKKARYRLRKKLGLESSESLEDFLNNLRLS